MQGIQRSDTKMNSKTLLQINLGLQALDYLSTIYFVNYLSVATEKNPLLQNSVNLLLAKIGVCLMFYIYYRIDQEKKSYRFVMWIVAIIYGLGMVVNFASVGFHLTG